MENLLLPMEENIGSMEKRWSDKMVTIECKWESMEKQLIEKIPNNYA